MSALVAYESSSEEDEPVQATVDPIAEPIRTTAAVSPAVNGQASHFASVPAQASEPGTARSYPSAEEPIVGPTMPDQVDNDLDVESTSGIQQTLSERDAVRFLTQASHPMTSMPSSPPGSPDPATNARLKRFLDLKTKGVHFNDDLASKSTFRNPSFLSTMMVRVGLDENDQYRTSLPDEIWDPLCFPRSAFKEDLLRSQQTIRERDAAMKKTLSASGKRTVEFTSGRPSGESSRDSTPGLSNTKRRRP